MKIILTAPFEGPAISRRPGQEVDTDDPSHKMDVAEATRLVDRGLANLVRAAKPEKTVRPRRTEKAVK